MSTITSPAFKANARGALQDKQLQRALSEVPRGLAARRGAARAGLPEFEALRDKGRDIKDHTLAYLDLYLEAFEKKATEAGSKVHFAPTAEDARRIVRKICRDARARVVTKGKSMISEEIGLNDALEADGIVVAETDLGEYLIQIRHETPSHIIAPAIHLTQDQVEADFRRLHTKLPADRQLIEPSQLVAEARQILREKFLAADVGITGANFMIAETGSTVIVTNEGNGDLTQSLPKVHIVLASIEKMVPTLEDVGTLIRAAGALGDGAGDLDLHHLLDGAAARRRSGRARGLPHRHPRQRPLGAAGHPVPRGAALHPLRGVHEPLPGLRRHRRARLRLGLSRSHRRGADAGADRRALGQAPAQRLDLLRALRGGVPDEDPAAGADAALAGGGVRRGRYAADVPGWGSRPGLPWRSGRGSTTRWCGC